MSEAERIGVEICSLEQVISQSDIISLHVPGTPSTHHMINRESIAQMKEGAYLVNTARGSLVDMDALVEALESGKLSGAALDVYEQEPMPVDAPILKCKNVVCTPHVGGETEGAYKRIAMSTARDIAAVLVGDSPKFCTNIKQLEQLKK